jgi:Thioredoxin reductase
VTKKTEFDVIIIGGGPAGLSAALWCSDLGLKSVVLERRSEFGGQLLKIRGAITNYLGREVSDGREMRDIFLAQVETRKNIDLKTEAEISNIDFEDLSVTCADDNVLAAKAVVIATGVRRRKLNVEGESEFYGKGILESGVRDKDLVKGKRILIVGGGDAALENTLLLAKTAGKIYVVHRGNNFKARSEFVMQLNVNPCIKVLFESVVTRFAGGEMINEARIKNIRTGETRILEIDAALIRIGIKPNTEFLNGQLELDSEGYLAVNTRCQTSRPNVFAIGDVANPISPTIGSSIGTGSTTAKAIFYLLNYKERL